MNVLSKVNPIFESMYDREELNHRFEEVNQNDLERVTKYAKLELPSFLLEILSEGKQFGFEINGGDLIVQFISANEILCTDENFFGFKTDVEKGIVFATDLGDSIFYYGEGKDGLGLYYVDLGVDYFADAIKFADTFEEFLIEGKGLNIIGR